MKTFRILSILAALLFCFVAIAVQAAEEKTPPNEIVFTSKNGDVTFTHAKHVAAAKKDCKVCHDTLFPQDKTAALNYKATMHKKAEKDATSCGSCHREGGAAFESKGNCAKCHEKKK